MKSATTAVILQTLTTLTSLENAGNAVVLPKLCSYGPDQQHTENRNVHFTSTIIHFCNNFDSTLQEFYDTLTSNTFNAVYAFL